MGQNISISKAARILGIKSSELSKRLTAAGVTAFEGEVDFEKVKCVAPNLTVGDIAEERQRLIRHNTLKPVAGHDSDATAQELSERVRRLTSDLAVEAQLNENYLQIIKEMADRLGALQMSEDGERREMAFELCEWLRAKVIAN
jgi:hypothetical protein